MPFTLTVSHPTAPLQIELAVGQCIFLLGANGAGKSGLMHKFFGANAGHARRISAHRQTWLSSNASTLSAHERRNLYNNITNLDANLQARWREDYSEQRTTLAIYDLLDAENVRARGITAAVDNDDLELMSVLRKKDAPIRVINDLLQQANLPIKLSVRANEEMFASKSGGPPYSAAELSDGERNALLLAATVLTAPEGTLILIDEPERHLHRSIISPLLSLLFAKRKDCAFVVSTHELMLPLDNPEAQTILVRSCTYEQNHAVAWEVDLLSSGAAVDERQKQDILGARRKMLFVEGEEQSLDRPLYALLFPGVSVVAKGSSRDVEHAVAGIRGSTDLHWLRAFGIIDNDGRPQPTVEQLRQRGIYALPVHSVESVYYHPAVQRRIAARVANVTGADADATLAAAAAAAINAVRPHVNRLSARVVEKKLRDEVERQLPTLPQITGGAPIAININVQAALIAERAVIEGHLANGRVEAVISRYPVRETQALDEIARRIGCQDRQQYEDAVRKLLIDDGEALLEVRGLLGQSSPDIAAE